MNCMGSSALPVVLYGSLKRNDEVSQYVMVGEADFLAGTSSEKSRWVLSSVFAIMLILQFYGIVNI